LTLIQAETIITELLKPIFAYTRKRCATPEDAEDLTQEIILRLFRILPKHDELADSERYCWTVVHNMLSNYYRKKEKSGFGVMTDDIADNIDLYNNFEQREIEQKLQIEIAYLSKTQRQVVIMYYYDNLKQQQIADKLGISLNMVKWHLYEAKNDLKRSIDTMRNNNELKFNPIKFDGIGCNGSTGTLGHISNFLRSSLSQNILYAVRNEAFSINEIADMLGVSPVYIESEAEFLTENCFLIKTGKKYISNCLIDIASNELTQLSEEMYEKAAGLLAPELFDVLNSQIKLGQDGIICPRDDQNFAMWSIFPYVAAFSGEELMPNEISFEQTTVIRPDGGQNICNCSILPSYVNPPKYWESMKNMNGPCWNSSEKFLLWLVDTEWSGNRVGDYNSTVGRDFLYLNRFFNGDKLSKDELAHLISRGYFKHEQSKISEEISLQIVWLKGKTAKERLIKIGDEIKRKYHEQLQKLKELYVRTVMENTPPHLKTMQKFGLQYIFYSDGWFLIHCLKNLVNSGRLKLPTEDQKQSLTAISVTDE